MLLAAMIGDIIGECGKFGLDIRKKTAGGKMSPSMEGSSIAQTRAGCPGLLVADPVVRGRFDQRPLAAHHFFYPRTPVGLSPGSFNASWHAVRAVFVSPSLLLAALACGGLCVTQQRRKNSHGSENPSVLL